MPRLTLLAACCWALLALGGCPDKKPRTIVLKVEGMTCNGCVKTITTGLQKVPGVTGAKVELKAKTATVTFKPDKTTPSAIAKAIDALGYKATPPKGG